MEKILLTARFFSLQGAILDDYYYLVLAGIIGFAFVVFLAAFLLTRIGKKKKYVFSILTATEDLLRGNLEQKIEVKENGDLAKIAANINQLVIDFKERIIRTGETRDYYRTLIEGVLDQAIIAASTEWDITFTNTGAARLFGWGREEVIGKSISIVFSEASWLNILPSLARRELRERPCIHKGEFRKKDGALFPGIASMNTVKTKTGELSGYLVVIRDLSEETKAETTPSAVHDSSIIDRLGEGVFILQQGRIVYANEAFAELVGFEREKLAGKHFKDLLSAEDLLPVIAFFREFEQKKEAEGKIDIALPDRQGRVPRVVTLSVRVSDFMGEKAIVGSTVSRRDVERMHREIRLNESRLDATLDTVSDGIIMITEYPGRSATVLANKSFLKLFGMGPEEIHGKSTGEVIARISQRSLNAQDFLHTLQKIISTDEHGTLLFEMKEPERKIIECSTAPLVKGHVHIKGRVFSFRDVTAAQDFEQKMRANAEELQSSKDALEKAYRELNLVTEDLQKRTLELDTLNQQLRRLDEMKTKLIANVSHELQTPLVAIKGYTDMILKRKLGAITDEQEKGLKVSLKNIERLIAMIDNLLNFARLGKSDDELVTEVFPLWKTIDETVELIREKMEASDISITTKYLTDDLNVRADREKIAQVFINLLSNAIKFNRHGGEVAVVVRKGAPGYCMVDVRDTGVGISPEHIGKIFERFYRADSSEAQLADGTGLGLSIVRDILSMHSCEITVQSTIGEGSTFTFSLPLAGSSNLDSTSRRLPREEDETKAKEERPGDTRDDASLIEDAGEDGLKRKRAIKIKIIKNPMRGDSMRN